MCLSFPFSTSLPSTTTLLAPTASLFQLSARLAGLALTQSLQLAGLLQWMVRQSAEVENNMTSGVLICYICTYMLLF